MTTLLNIQSSPHCETSLSRSLSKQFIEQWMLANPDGKIINRDVMKTELPYINTTWLSGAFIPAENHTPEMTEALKISEELVAEFKAADEILIGTPMHNFTIPANFKAYLDQVVRFNHTYNLNGGMLKDKATTIIVASGRLYTANAPYANCDHVSGLLKCLLNYMGINSVQVVLAGGMRAVNLKQETFENHLKTFDTAISNAVQLHQQFQLAIG